MTRYIGKVCEKHPDAGGERLISCRKCVVCHNVTAKDRRREIIKERTPPWADKAKIRIIYRRAREAGKTVDHKIPLQGKKVSGLHVETNLRVISSVKNSSKGNKFRK